MILVTGGTGFLGSHLLYHLLNEGEHVRALKRAGANMDVTEVVFSYYMPDYKKLFDKIEWIEGDLMDIFSLEKALDGVDDVYHCAALVSFLPADREKMMDTNINGTANLVNIALEKKIRKLCHVSSIAAIGRAENDKPIDEEVVWKASKRNSNYAKSKYGSEKEVWRGIEEGMNAVIINPSVILGPGDLKSGGGKLIRLIQKGLRFYTEGVNGYVDARDVAKAMYLLMKSDIANERFIVSSENVSLKNIVYQIAEYISKPAPKYKATPFMGEMAWRFDKLRGLLTGQKPFITKETAETAGNKYYYTSKKLIKALDFEFIPVKESLIESCELFLKVEK
jgi:nucleoside-diphosphate-sugar epimerase